MQQLERNTQRGAVLGFDVGRIHSSHLSHLIRERSMHQGIYSCPPMSADLPHSWLLFCETNEPRLCKWWCCSHAITNCRTAKTSSHSPSCNTIGHVPTVDNNCAVPHKTCCRSTLISLSPRTFPMQALPDIRSHVSNLDNDLLHIKGLVEPTASPHSTGLA
jgi:hypothetical protein